MTVEIALAYLLGSWGLGFMFGLIFRVVLKNYVEWFT